MKGHQGTSILCATMLFGAVLVSPAFAQMKKVDEAELAQANASVTGESVNKTVATEKGAAVPETVTTGNLARESVLVPSNNALESVGISLNIKGQETFQFRVDNYRSETRGGVTGVSSHR